MLNMLLMSMVLVVITVDRSKDFQVLKDVAKSVDRYTQFMIFDDVNASVKDGVVILIGKVRRKSKARPVAGPCGSKNVSVTSSAT